LTSKRCAHSKTLSPTSPAAPWSSPTTASSSTASAPTCLPLKAMPMSNGSKATSRIMRKTKSVGWARMLWSLKDSNTKNSAAERLRFFVCSQREAGCFSHQTVRCLVNSARQGVLLAITRSHPFESLVQLPKTPVRAPYRLEVQHQHFAGPRCSDPTLVSWRFIPAKSANPLNGTPASPIAVPRGGPAMCGQPAAAIPHEDAIITLGRPLIF